MALKILSLHENPKKKRVRKIRKRKAPRPKIKIVKTVYGSSGEKRLWRYVNGKRRYLSKKQEKRHRIQMMEKNPAKRKKRRTRIIRARKNKRGDISQYLRPTHRYLISAIGIIDRRQRTMYFTGQGFSDQRGKAKIFTSEAAVKSEAKRIQPLLPRDIDRIWTELA